MNDRSRFIKANKCEVDKVYYLPGGWYKHTAAKSFPLINTPVVFKGRDRSQSGGNAHRHWSDQRGQFVFINDKLNLMFAIHRDSEVCIEPQREDVDEVRLQRELNQKYKTEYGYANKTK